jgi:Peptidase A4 family
LIVTAFAFLFLLSSFAFVPTSAAATGAPTASSIHMNSAASPAKKPTKFDCPDCWSGYGLNSTKSGAVTAVWGSFTVPTLKCGSGTTISFLLVALDGTASNDFSYAGVYVECSSGSASYGAVWYNAADGSSGSASWTPSAGDSVTMSIVESKGTNTFTLTDNTQKATSTGTGADTGMVLEFATCFTDMASGYGQSPFGTVSFTDCQATVNGNTGAIGSLTGKTVSLVEFITVNSGGTKALNKVGKLTSGEDFTVTYKKAGP